MLELLARRQARPFPLLRYQRNRHNVTMSWVSRSSRPIVRTRSREPSSADGLAVRRRATGPRVRSRSPRSRSPSWTSAADTVVRGVPNANRTSPAVTPAASTPHRTRYGEATGRRRAPRTAATASRWVVVRKGRLSSRAAMLATAEAHDELDRDARPAERRGQARGRRPRDRGVVHHEGDAPPRRGRRDQRESEPPVPPEERPAPTMATAQTASEVVGQGRERGHHGRERGHDVGEGRLHPVGRAGGGNEHCQREHVEGQRDGVDPPADVAGGRRGPVEANPAPAAPVRDQLEHIGRLVAPRSVRAMPGSPRVTSRRCHRHRDDHEPPVRRRTCLEGEARRTTATATASTSAGRAIEVDRACRAAEGSG